MSHVVVPNYQAFLQTEPFNIQWKLTRVMLAAGWRYKASGTATGAAKDTTFDASKDQWAVGGGINLIQVGAQTGTAPQIAAASSGTSIITLVSGFVANSVGRFLTISGALNANNNGTFRITAQAGTSVTVWNPGAVLETGSSTTTWTEKHGGAGATITATGTAGAIPGRAILTGLTGMVTPTTSPLSRGSVGDRITIANATTPTNNGTYLITRVVSATSVEIAREANLNNGIAASITTFVTPTVTLTGGVNFTAASVGRYITISGAASAGNNGTFLITVFNSATSVGYANPAGVASDANSPNIHWVESSSSPLPVTSDASVGTLIWSETSPLSQTYGLHLQGATGAGAWLNLQGPSTMKIPVGTNIPTGTFVKGEVVTQTTTGAQGLITGLCLDTVGGLGFIVVEPRLSGTGAQATGPRGWNNTNNTDTITGVTSGATITTPVNSVPVEYVREVVFWKNSAFQGHMFHQTIDQALEGAARFSSLAGNTGTTTSVCPGGATNTFPVAGSYVSLGTGGSNAAGTGANNWFGTSGNATNLGNTQFMCTNCIEGSGVSADGSWIAAIGGAGSSPAVYFGTMFMRCDDGEEGDVDPYVVWNPCGSSGAYPMNGSTRTTNTSVISNVDYFEANAFFLLSAFSPYKGWRRRGFPTGDAYQEFQAVATGCAGASAAALLVSTNPQQPGKVATQVATNLFVKDDVWVVSTQVLQKMRKGRMRWCMLTEGGVANTTYLSGTWIQLGTGINGPVVAGPWDGQTTPTNA
jgi:hypothetical protein